MVALIPWSTSIKGNFVSASYNNDHALAIATYKMVNSMPPEIMS